MGEAGCIEMSPISSIIGHSNQGVLLPHQRVPAVAVPVAPVVAGVGEEEGAVLAAAAPVGCLGLALWTSNNLEDPCTKIINP